MDQSRPGLTKEELLLRVWVGATASVAPRITRVWLDDLIKDGLISGAQPIGHDGRRTIYRHDYRDYRRAAQIVRFQRYGNVSRDSLWVLLFLNGYGVTPALVREALAREWVRWGSNLLGQVRSGYLANEKVIPPKHKAAFVRDLGVLDKSLADLALPISENLSIAMLRAGANAQIKTLHMPNFHPTRVNLLKTFSAPGLFARWAINSMTGLLLFGGKKDDRGGDAVEGLILNATDAELDMARFLSIKASSKLSSFFGAMVLGRDPNRSTVAADRVIRHTIRNHAGYAAFLLVIFLKLMPLFRGLSKPALQKASLALNRFSLVRLVGRRISTNALELSTKP